MYDFNSPEYMTTADAASALGVGVHTVTRWIRNGTLPAYRVGQRSYRIHIDAVAAMVVTA